MTKSLNLLFSYFKNLGNPNLSKQKTNFKVYVYTVKNWANQIGPVRFAEKTSQNTVPADLLWEKNNVSAEKRAEKYGL